MIAISYRREDSLPIAGRLYDRLEAKFGKQNVFMDFDSIRPGFDFRQQIKETIERSNLVIAVIGPHWLGEQGDGSRRIDDPTDFVRLEIEYALERGIPIIPLLINDTLMPKPEKLPSSIEGLAFRHALPLDSGLDFRQHAERLIAAISDSIASREKEKGKSVSWKQLQSNNGEAGRKQKRFLIWAAIIFVLAVGAAAVWLARGNPRGQAKEEARPPAAAQPPVGTDRAGSYQDSEFEKLMRDEANLLRRVVELNSAGRFDESEALVLKFLNDEPGATADKILHSYLADLESRNETERTIRIVTQVIERIKSDRRWAGQILERRAIAILYGRYGDTRDPKDLAAAKEDLNAVLKYGPYAEAYLHLGMLAAMEGQIDEAKSYFHKSVDNSDNVNVTKGLRTFLWQIDADPKGFSERAKNFYESKLAKPQPQSASPTSNAPTPPAQLAAASPSVTAAPAPATQSPPILTSESWESAGSKAKCTSKKQKLVRVYVKRVGFHLLLPVEIFPDAATLNQNDGQGNPMFALLDTDASIHFTITPESLAQAYARLSGDKGWSGGVVYYKALNDSSFTVWRQEGVFVSGVKKSGKVFLMNVWYHDQICPFHPDTLKAMASSFIAAK